MRFSVVVSTYDVPARHATLDSVLRAWLLETPDVWLADCSGRFKTSLPVKIVSASTAGPAVWDVGNRLRHSVALLTEGDIVIKADDDVLPEPGLRDDFKAVAIRYPEAILGLIGRRFHGPHYYGETEFFKARTVGRPTFVDFVGVITAAHRSALAFDLRGCTTEIEDLHWQMGAFPGLKKIVIPSTCYSNLADAKSATCLFHREGAREKREEYYREMFAQNYRGLAWEKRADAREP